MSEKEPETIPVHIDNMGRKVRKRTPDQLNRDRARISTLVLQGHNPKEIIQIIKDEVGYELSPTQVGVDITAIRKQWLDTQEINYAAILAQELDRLDALELMLWTQLRASATPNVRRSVERWVKEASAVEMTEEDMDKLAAKITETTDGGKIDPIYFGHILRVQQERRKMLGLYAPEIKQTRQEIIVKGYVGVSPSDWDEAPVEGEYERLQ